MRCTLVVVVLMLVEVASLASTARPTPLASQPEWRGIAAGGVSLEYRPRDEALARELLPELPGVLQSIGAMHDPTMGQDLRRLAARRSECLRFIANKIGQPKPGKWVTKAFDDSLRKQNELISAYTKLHRFQLWSRNDLLQAFHHGDRIAGFEYDANHDDYVRSLNADFESRHQTELARFPLVSGSGSGSEALEEARQALLTLGDVIRHDTAPFIPFHESAECGIVADLGVHTAFRRWFCDGVAQWVAEMAMLQFGGEAAHQHMVALYDAYTDPGMAAKVDLLAWRALEYEPLMPKAPGVVDSLAHYGFAVGEIRGLAERHGPDVIAKVLTRLSTSPSERRDSRAILAAIKAVTGEDLADSLSKYGREAGDPFRGVAIGNLKYYRVAVAKPTHEKPVLLAPGAPVKLDANHDIRVDFYYEILDRPATMLLSIGGLPGFREITISLEGKGPSRASRLLGLSDYAAAVLPRTVDLRLTLNGTLLAQLPLQAR